MSSEKSILVSLARFFDRFNNFFTHDLLGGPRPWKFQFFVYFAAVSELGFIAFLSWHFGLNSAAAWVYAALHGSHAVLWFIKSLAFPDPRWQPPITIPAGLATAVLINPYIVFGWFAFSDSATRQYPLPEGVWLSLCILLACVSLFFLMVSDAQKYFTKKARKGLIIDGMFKHIRYPNYLGQIGFYISLVMICWHWIPVSILGYTTVTIFLTNIILLDETMSKYPNWQSYKEKTARLLPGIF